MEEGSPPPARIRDATADDMATVVAIYAVHADDPNSVVTFEERAPSVEEMTQRWREYTAGNPKAFIVAEVPASAEGETAETVVGYAYFKPFRMRPAYRFTVEESVYIAPGYSGRGIGKALLGELLERCMAAGLRSVTAVLGTREDNPASVALHEKLGFRSVGVMQDVGWKSNRWVARLIMERILGRESPPTRVAIENHK